MSNRNRKIDSIIASKLLENDTHQDTLSETKDDFSSYYYVDENHILRHVDEHGKKYYVAFDGEIILFEEKDVKVCLTKEEYTVCTKRNLSGERICIPAYNLSDSVKRRVIVFINS